MGRFEGLGNAAMFDRGMYIKPEFLGRLRIEKCLVKKSRKSGDLFTVEFTVVKGNLPEHPAGTKVTWQQSLKDIDVAFSALKPFVYAVLGLSYTNDKARIVKEVDPELEGIMERAVGEENELVGAEVDVRTYTKKTKERGVDFTVHEWSPAAK